VNEGIKILTQHDPNIDEVWCVFDQESQNEKNDYERALKIKNGIQLPDHKKFFCAISNPCFEFWILLHIEKTDMPFNNCSEVYKYIKTKIPLYTKSNNLEIRKLCSLASTAVFNSYWLRERKLSCPATNVDKLMMALSKSRFGNTTND
jgi:hypothetical protein